MIDGDTRYFNFYQLKMQVHGPESGFESEFEFEVRFLKKRDYSNLFFKSD